MPKQNRGEVWLVDLGMVAKVRPCLVISIPARVQDRALVTVVTHTTSARGSRFEIPIRTRFLDTGVFDAQSLVTVSDYQVKHGLLSEYLYQQLKSPLLKINAA